MAIISDQIQEACDKAGRKKESVKTMVVTKNHGFEVTKMAYEHGFRLFGENRIQETQEKYAQNHGLSLELHMIGHLQSNKAKIACELCSCIQSIDKIKTLLEVQKQAKNLDKVQDVMFQINTSLEDSKSGVRDINELWPLIDQACHCPNIKVIGLMTIGPFDAPEKKIRRCFSDLRELGNRIISRYPGINLKDLSMGMSDDFHLAIAEGATLLRLGRILLGERYA
ncbi:MAG: YggS family pyridoxal phosphate-dependent enzyme [Spirochaetales bacterium]|nr:YggS family pyridoxal phosphate-dependent enzyme [Spirochaetales bacterium]